MSRKQQKQLRRQNLLTKLKDWQEVGKVRTQQIEEIANLRWR